MNESKYKGTLKTWKDDRGFGFIKPENGTEEIFVHISAIQNKSRRPQVGDVLYYQKTTENGKIRASNVFIGGLPVTTHKNTKSKRASKRKPTSNLFEKLVPIAVITVIAVIASQFRSNNSSPTMTSISDSPPITASIPKPGCNIKGNVSVASGNKIYHVPGQEDYESTIIDPSKGERWFCSESEAINNGWRKAPR